MRSPVSRILMTADCIGGVWSYCLGLARSARWRDINIYLATMGRPLSRSQAAEAAALPNLQVLENPCKLEWMDDPWSDVEASGEWLLELEDQFSPDIVHLNTYAHAALPFQAPKVLVGHSCVLSWFQAVKGTSAPEPQWQEYRRAVHRGLHAADVVVAPSCAMLDALNQFYGPFQNSTAIYNGADLSTYRPGNKEPFVLSAGRLWDEGKNIESLADVGTGIDWPIYVAGERGDSKKENESWNALRSLGKLSSAALAGWLGRASIYALPARYEPFGLSILEAGLSGCALVVGDIPSLREIWGDAALFVKPNDPLQLKQMLQRLILDRSELEALSRQALNRSKQFGIDESARAYLDVYRDLIAKTRREKMELIPCA